jgi:hypothetical protein
VTAVCDTTKAFRDANVNGEVIEAIAFRWPVWIERADMLSEFVADT